MLSWVPVRWVRVPVRWVRDGRINNARPSWTFFIVKGVIPYNLINTVNDNLSGKLIIKSLSAFTVLIFILIFSYFMEIYFVKFVLAAQFTFACWRIIGAVIKTISFPGNVAKFYPLNFIVYFFA